jgi:two-component system, OmpR family, phosphate regulon response regulator PhoB
MVKSGTTTHPLTQGTLPMARILIADDDELIAELASEVLIDAGYACGWVTSAAAAWACVQKKRPDILLLDQSMPGESGMTLLRRLRRSPQLYDLPVIMFTAMNGEQDEVQAIYAGAQDFISKPFDPADMVRRVARLMKLRAGRPRHVDLAAAVSARETAPQAASPGYRRVL